MAKKREELKALHAFHVALPAKYIIVELMSDGSVHSRGVTTRYQATHGARASDPQSFEVQYNDLVLAGAKVAFDKFLKKS